MIRTKYLLVSILVCLLTIIGVGVFSVAPHTIGMNTSEASVIFAVAQDSYHIEKYVDTMKDSTRRAFIDKVRNSIAQDPVVVLKKAPSPPEENEEDTVSVPPQVRPTPMPLPIQEAPVLVTPVVVTQTPEPEPMVTPKDTTDSATQTEEVQGEETPII